METVHCIGWTATGLVTLDIPGKCGPDASLVSNTVALQWFMGNAPDPHLSWATRNFFFCCHVKSFCFTNRNTQNPTGRRRCLFLTASLSTWELTSPVRKLLTFYTGYELNVGIIWFVCLFHLASKWKMHILLLNQHSSLWWPCCRKRAL